MRNVNRNRKDRVLVAESEPFAANVRVPPPGVNRLLQFVRRQDKRPNDKPLRIPDLQTIEPSKWVFRLPDLDRPAILGLDEVDEQRPIIHLLPGP